MPEWMQNHSGGICLVFLHCVFSNVTSVHLDQSRHSHNPCICLVFLHCVFSNASSNCLPERMHSHICCICLSFPHCVFSNVSSNGLPERMQIHTVVVVYCLKYKVHNCLKTASLLSQLDWMDNDNASMVCIWT